MLNKRKRLVITSEQIIQCSIKNGEIRLKNTIEELKGITKSLLVDSKNFILHFKNQPCMEWQSDDRDEIIEVIQQVYYLKVTKKNPQK